MTALVASELLKLRTTRAWIGYLLTVLVLAGAASAGTVGTAEPPLLGSAELSQDVVSAALFAAIVAFVLGIVSVTGEWRHGTITRTLLATPRRWRVLAAKELGMLVAASALALFALAVALAVAVSWLTVDGASFVVDGTVIRYALRVVVATALWAALGVAVGAVVLSQTPALVGAILWVLLGEALLTALLGLVDLERVGEYLPGRALSSFDGSEPGGLSMWAALAVALAWIAALALLGHLRIARQDVT